MLFLFIIIFVTRPSFLLRRPEASSRNSAPPSMELHPGKGLRHAAKEETPLAAG